jgi:Anti-sigma factor NepR
VTRPAKPINPSVKAGGVKFFDTAGAPVEARHAGVEKGGPSGPCLKKSGPKPDAIADQIAQHLRSIYDDVLKQPVPGRFRELLRQLECASATRPGKDRM